MPNGQEFKLAAIVPMRPAMPRFRHSLAAMLAAGSLSALAFAPAAGAAGDPIASGHFNLDLSSGYKHQLKVRKTSLSMRGLSIASGLVNPTDGTASLQLNGRITFRHRRAAVTFDNLTATIG